MQDDDSLDVLLRFAVAKAVPDRDLLDDFVRRYPQHAEALADLAVDLVLAYYTEDADD